LKDYKKLQRPKKHKKCRKEEIVKTCERKVLKKSCKKIARNTLRIGETCRKGSV